MPYRCSGRTLQKKKGGKWVKKAKCKSAESCKAQMRLLYGLDNGLKPRGRK